MLKGLEGTGQLEESIIYASVESAEKIQTHMLVHNDKEGSKQEPKLILT